MRLLLITAIFAISLLQAFAQAQHLHRNASFPSNGHRWLKRWYGVQAITASTDTEEDGMPNVYPWPTTCTSPYTQPIRYCFKDARSAKNLKEIVDGANAMWAHATQVTALKIELAAGCGGDPEVICSDDRLKEERDALVISDETKDNDPDWNTGDECQTSTVIGYRYGEKNRPYRHTLKFCSLSADIKNGDSAHAIRAMAHELGHAMGLQHEHQRPDRDKYIKFNYKYLQGYDEAKAAVDADSELFFEDEDTPSFKMRATISDYSFAKHYFPNVIEHIKGSGFDDPDWKDHGALDESIWDTYQMSSQFDYNSIMIYDGTLGLNTARAGKYVLTRADDNQPVWMGGGVNGDPATTKISEGDVARIAMLYDAHTPECDAAKKGTTWSPLRVKVRRDGEWYVVHPPRKRDEL